MKKCSHASFVLTLKYVESENLVMPGKPRLLLDKSVRVLANTIIKL